MLPQIRYQIFVSSTYEDLREERQQATQAILEAGFFPSGMELFPASDDTQWGLIQRVIEESDYYIVIVGGRYGSLGPQGLSYTEMEYDYAIEKGIPVLGFVRSNVGDITAAKSEASERGRKKLEVFRQKVMSRTCRKYSNPIELGMLVMKSLISETRVRPRTGWVRADHARSEEDLQRERLLTTELAAAHKRVDELERELRDGALLTDVIPRDQLAQGDDKIEWTITFSDENKTLITETISLTWDELFRVIAPSMYGYIQRKRANYESRGTYVFHDDLIQHIRTKVISRAQNRKISVQSSQIDRCIIQFKELGLLRYAETEDDEGGRFRGVTLTELGERHLTMLSTLQRVSPAMLPPAIDLNAGEFSRTDIRPKRKKRAVGVRQPA